MGMAPPTRGLAVLVVDDHMDTADSFAHLLGLAGHTVVTARDGPSAEAAITGLRPDAILTDVGLPGADGYRVAERLCEQLGYRPLLVALTGLCLRGGWRASWAFSAYLTAVTSFGVVLMVVPATNTPDFWMARQSLYDALLFGIALELGYRSFSGFPNLARRAKIGLAVVVLASAAFVYGLCMKIAPPATTPSSGLPLNSAFVSLSTTRLTCSSSLCVKIWLSAIVR